MSGAQTEIRFASDPEFIEVLEEELAQDREQLTVVSENLEEDPASLGFDFGVAAVLIGLASDLFFDEPLVRVLWRALRRTRPRRVRIDTPLGTASFEPREDMTEDEIRSIVKQLADVRPG